MLQQLCVSCHAAAFCEQLALCCPYLPALPIRSPPLCLAQLATLQSYYGGLHCCAWSPDGRYVAAGGEDDMLALYGLTGG